jgi:hypothetical protein
MPCRSDRAAIQGSPLFTSTSEQCDFKIRARSTHLVSIKEFSGPLRATSSSPDARRHVSHVHLWLDADFCFSPVPKQTTDRKTQTDASHVPERHDHPHPSSDRSLALHAQQRRSQRRSFHFRDTSIPMDDVSSASTSARAPRRTRTGSTGNALSSRRSWLHCSADRWKA